MHEFDRALEELRHTVHRIITRSPDPRLDEILAGVRNIQQEIARMSGTQDTLAAEVAALKANMANLHTGVTDIQTRLAAAIAAGGTSDPAALVELAAINTDLEAVVADLAPKPPVV